jgi:hypothetical protein
VGQFFLRVGEQGWAWPSAGLAACGDGRGEPVFGGLGLEDPAGLDEAAATHRAASGLQRRRRQLAAPLRKAPATGRSPRQEGTALNDEHYTVEDLRAELRRFENELRAAGLRENSVSTYVDRTGRFLKWLDGDYHPRGPN